MRAIQNYINGKSASANGGRAGRVYNPNTGSQQAEVAFSAARDVDAAVAAASAAFPAWAATNPQRRARVMFAFKQLVEKNMEARALFHPAAGHRRLKGDIQRGLEVIEFACGIRMR
jgi:malonate-semialdehyde dehydrogenase (acetylating)/methylmalonate-semialdehyde dehydrogenase